MTLQERLTNYVRAVYPCVAVNTTDERMVIGYALAAAKAADREVMRWTATTGLVRIQGARAVKVQDTQDLMAACMSIAAAREKIPDGGVENAVILLSEVNTWPLNSDPILLRALRDLIANSPALASTVIVIGRDWTPPASIEHFVTIVQHELPTVDEMVGCVNAMAETTKIPGPSNDTIARALCGMTIDGASNALALSYVESKEFRLDIVYREKVAAVNRTQLLTVMPPHPLGLDAIGGLANLKAWLSKRTKAFSAEARAYGVREPRGLLLVGVPGTGKTLAAKAIGTAWNRPTLRLDCGTLFNSLVGESERRIREVLALAEAMAPCILFCDEIDKGLAGAGGSGDSDSGVTKRVFGTILTWMQERTAPVFVVATANQIETIPPEFTRKGRFDQIYSLDLPTAAERADVLRVVLAERGRAGAGIDIEAVVGATADFTPAEIFAAVDDAITSAFDAGKPDVTTADVIAAARDTVPLAVSAKDRIDNIRAWAATYGKPAGEVDPARKIDVEEHQRRRGVVGVVIGEGGPPPPPPVDKKNVS